MGLKDRLTPEIMASLVSPPASLSLSAVGEQFTVSRQRVHQVYKEYKRTHPHLFVNRADPTRDQLAAMLEQNMAITKIASEFSISINRLKRLLESYDLQKTFIKDSLSAELLKELYINKEFSDQEIADQHHCSPNTVMKLRYQHGIYEEMRRPLKDKLPVTLFHELYAQRNLLLVQLAELYRENLQNIIALKKQYHIRKRRSRGVSPEELSRVKADLIARGFLVR